MRIVAFIPIKLNNERLPGKNLKCFDNGKPLISYILNTATKISLIDDIYVYCSSDTVKAYLPPRVQFLRREETLDLSSTGIMDVISAFVNDVSSDIYVLIHATAPFISANSIERGIRAVIEGGFDSAFSVEKHYDFLWMNGKPANYNVLEIPRTQDLEPYYTETTGMYIFTKELFQTKRRIGDRPYLVDVSKIEAFDINEPIDFIIANAVYSHHPILVDSKGEVQT